MEPRRRGPPGLLRTLGGAGIALESIQLARPTLDDAGVAVPLHHQRDGDAYAGHYGGSVMVEGIAVAVGLAAVCLCLAGRVFVRENA